MAHTSPAPTIGTEEPIDGTHDSPATKEPSVLVRKIVSTLLIAIVAGGAHVPDVVLSTKTGRKNVVPVHQKKSAGSNSVKVAVETFAGILGHNNLGAFDTTEVAPATMQLKNLHPFDGILPALMPNIVLAFLQPKKDFLARNFAKDNRSLVVFDFHATVSTGISSSKELMGLTTTSCFFFHLVFFQSSGLCLEGRMQPS